MVKKYFKKNNKEKIMNLYNKCIPSKKMRENLERFYLKDDR